MKTTDCGRLGELAAADYLIEKGYEIESMNYRSRYGEIDIIASDGEYIVFAEVKTRSANMLASPAEYVTIPKQRKIISTAWVYIQKIGTDLQPRFDILEVYIKSKGTFEVEKIIHLEAAFDAEAYNALF